MKKMLIAALALCVLAGCSRWTRRENNIFVGAAIGSILFVPGALIGGYIGSTIR